MAYREVRPPHEGPEIFELVYKYRRHAPINLRYGLFFNALTPHFREEEVGFFSVTKFLHAMLQLDALEGSVAYIQEIDRYHRFDSTSAFKENFVEEALASTTYDVPFYSEGKYDEFMRAVVRMALRSCRNRTDIAAIKSLFIDRIGRNNSAKLFNPDGNSRPTLPKKFNHFKDIIMCLCGSYEIQGSTYLKLVQLLKLTMPMFHALKNPPQDFQGLGIIVPNPQHEYSFFYCERYDDYFMAVNLKKFFSMLGSFLPSPYNEKDLNSVPFEQSICSVIDMALFTRANNIQESYDTVKNMVTLSRV